MFVLLLAMILLATPLHARTMGFHGYEWEDFGYDWHTVMPATTIIDAIDIASQSYSYLARPTTNSQYNQSLLSWALINTTSNRVWMPFFQEPVWNQDFTRIVSNIGVLNPRTHLVNITGIPWAEGHPYDIDSGLIFTAMIIRPLNENEVVGSIISVSRNDPHTTEVIAHGVPEPNSLLVLTLALFYLRPHKTK